MKEKIRTVLLCFLIAGIGFAWLVVMGISHGPYGSKRMTVDDLFVTIEQPVDPRTVYTFETPIYTPTIISGEKK